MSYFKDGALIETCQEHLARKLSEGWYIVGRHHHDVTIKKGDIQRKFDLRGDVATYTTPGSHTWTCPVGIFAVQVEEFGGGAAGKSTPAPSTLDQGSGYVAILLYSGGKTRYGERLNSWPASVITAITFKLYNTGGCGGPLSCTVRKVSDDSLLGTIGSMDASGVPDGGDYNSVTFNSTPVIVPAAQDIRIQLEYSGGDSGHYIQVHAGAGPHNGTYYDGSITDGYFYDPQWYNLTYYSLGGNGGGGGAYSKLNTYAVTPGNNYTCYVGAGGVTTGQAGVDSYFVDVATCLAKGGTNPTGGAKASCVGDVKYSGGDGYITGVADGGGGGSSAGTVVDGNTATDKNGGAAPTGGAAGGKDNTVGGNYGGGGGGADASLSTFGAGAGGEIILTWTVSATAPTTSIVAKVLACGMV
jgi:hypothetical protein